MPELLENIILSSNPCPTCVDAAGQEAMTYTEWDSSLWGLPASSARICEQLCHCILLPIDMKDEFPEIGKRSLLRGDKGTDIPKIVEIGTGEADLIALMEQYNDEIGVLPKSIYTMTVEDALAFLRGKL